MNTTFCEPTNVLSSLASKVRTDLLTLEAILRAHGDKNGIDRLQGKRQDLNDPSVFVFVIGEGNFGKSSLINHILGRPAELGPPVADVSHLPKTWRIDLYRHSPDGKEYAELRRSNVAGIQRLSIKEARAECVQQEAQVFKDVREGRDNGTDGAASFYGQIIEVNWCYTNLATPRNVVLVDTPGFLQALGSNRQRVETISSSKGVVFADLHAAYEYYYPRANVVLWAFRADRINDRDTVETFQALAEQRKTILGAITFFDLMKTEQEQQEVLRRAEKLFGSQVASFLPVVTGGKTSLLGHGIPDVRKQLEHISDQAAVIKLEEAAQFATNEASSCQKWMTQKGDLLIVNVTQISFYCNATSSSLLREAKTSYAALVQYFKDNTIPEIVSSSFPTFIRATLEAASKVPALRVALAQGRQPTSEDKEEMVSYFNRDISEKLRLSDLNKQFQNKLQYISNYIVAEGKRQSAGHHLAQIVIHQSGETRKHKLEGQINPPDVKTLTVAFPSLALPMIFSSVTDEIFDFIGGFAGGVLKIFGWQSKAEKNERLMLSAIEDTKYSAQSLPQQMEKAMKQYVVQAAQAVLKSADEAVGKVYPSKNLISLKDDAVEIDKHLDQLQAFFKASPMQNESRYLYKTLYALWSPRDDPRRAVIDTFCEWFGKKQVEFSRECEGWLTEVLPKTFLDEVGLNNTLQAYLIRTDQAQEMRKPVLVGSIGQTSESSEIKDYTYLWSSHLAQGLAQKQLFDDRENFLKIKFDGFEVQGIAHEFSEFLSREFNQRFDRHFNLLTVYGDSRSMPMFDTSKVYGIKPLATLTGIGILSALGLGSVEYLLGIKLGQDVANGVVAGVSVSGVGLAVNWTHHLRAFQRHRHEVMVAAVTSELCEKLIESTNAAWRETHSTLTPHLARQLIGYKTLVKKRALDFAIEGEFLNASF